MSRSSKSGGSWLRRKLKRATSALLLWLSISHTRRLRFRTRCEPADPGQLVLDKLPDTHALRVSKSLRTYLDHGNYDVLVTLVGPGSRKGFLGWDTPVNGQVPILPPSWWTGLRGRVFVFAYSSFSANIIKRELKTRYVTSAIAFESSLWVYVDSQNPWTIEFNAWFINELSNRVFSNGVVDDRGYIEALAWFEQVITMVTIPDCADAEDFSYQLALTCLLRQKDTVHLIA